jgi:hypothetical protein
LGRNRAVAGAPAARVAPLLAPLVVVVPRAGVEDGAGVLLLLLGSLPAPEAAAEPARPLRDGALPLFMVD